MVDLARGARVGSLSAASPSRCRRGRPAAEASSAGRRQAIQGAALAGWLGSWLPGKGRAQDRKPRNAEGRPTNEVVSTVNGIRQRRLGNSDIIVSEMGLGTQRWGSTDFNAPDEALCHAFLSRAVLEDGVNLVDTAEQYPIPSNRTNYEGRTEEIIGSWLRKGTGRRQRLVIASKITGGVNVTARKIRSDCEGSLRRLGTDYLDIYLLHWPARYTPQANWGQSLQYHQETESSPYYANAASFEEIALAMGELVESGMIRGWGMCNDNAYGLTASCYTADALGVARPVAMQNDFSLLNRRAEENGVSEASSPTNENVGFMAYNALAGGMLTGKYLEIPAALDDANERRAMKSLQSPRGRMDDRSWGPTLYRYRSAAALAAIEQYAALAKESGMSLTEMSLRWCRQRQAVTTTLVGQTSIQQLEQDLSAFHASEELPEDLMWEIDRVHMQNRLPIFSSSATGKDWRGVGEIGERIP